MSHSLPPGICTQNTDKPVYGMNTKPNMGGVGKIGREANRGNKAGKQTEQRQMTLAPPPPLQHPIGLVLNLS